jgi:MFS superfamily sulfate permease-like transporter
MYIPMALSLSSNLAHAPAINGLYSFVFNPLVYAILGSSPQLVVGPEAAGSLLVGSIVKSSVEQGHTGEEDEMMQAMVVGVVTAMAGSMILVAGIARLGFLDNVLSRPFLRGFITAIGFVIFVDQLIPELGLATKGSTISHGSTVDKIVFLVRNIKDVHVLTAAVAGSSFVIIMVFRYVYFVAVDATRSLCMTDILPVTAFSKSVSRNVIQELRISLIVLSSWSYRQF